MKEKPTLGVEAVLVVCWSWEGEQRPRQTAFLGCNGAEAWIKLGRDMQEAFPVE